MGGICRWSPTTMSGASGFKGNAAMMTSGKLIWLAWRNRHLRPRLFFDQVGVVVLLVRLLGVLEQMLDPIGGRVVTRAKKEGPGARRRTPKSNKRRSANACP
jgi:hypothetical protein